MLGQGPRQLAEELGYMFLRSGRFEAAGGPIDLDRPGVSAVAIADDRESASDFASVPAEFKAFEGLSVQAVGYGEQGEGSDQASVSAEDAVHIYLTRGSARAIRELPKEIDGVPVRVHKMGPITIRPEAGASATHRGYLFERNTRICCGSSSAPTSENISGTFGAIVRLPGESDLFLASNNHVFSGCNHTPDGQPIMAPSTADSRPDRRAPVEIGRHYRPIELRSGNPSFVPAMEIDFALARVTAPEVITSWQGPPENGYDTPASAISPRFGMPVRKCGRTTGLTRGYIEARVSVPMAVTYNARNFKGSVWFKNVWTVRASGNDAFALPGDSGSLVVSDDGQAALGFVFAANASGSYAWMVPMSAVTEQFPGLTLVGQHGV